MKHAIRSSVLAKRNSLSSAQVESKSRKIMERLLSMHQLNSAETVMLYYSFVNEPKTEPIVQHLLNLGKKVVLPLTVPSTRVILPLLVTNSTKCHPNKFGIPEPNLTECENADESRIDAVVLPGIAFDLKGNRVGFGYGYYDKFLKKLRPDCARIALAFEMQIVKDAHAKEHDVPVDFIVTEKRLIDCRKNRRF